MTAKLILLAFLSINLVTFLWFGWDKSQAQQGGWRTSESNLLSLALIGGTPAAYLARHVFRHKTRKQPFSNILFAILVLQLSGIVGLAFYRA